MPSEDYWRGWSDGEILWQEYALSNERTVPHPDIDDKSAAYKKGFWEGFNRYCLQRSTRNS